MPEAPEKYRKRYLPIDVDGICGRTYVYVRSYKSSFASANTKYRKAAYNDFRNFILRRGPYADDDHGASHYYWGSGWVYSAEMYPSHWAWIDLGMLKAMFQGVGRPSDFGRILRLADLYLGTAEFDAVQMKELGWTHRMFSLQQWTDWYLGTDCRGFVGAYLAENRPHISDTAKDLSFYIDGYDDTFAKTKKGGAFTRIDDARQVRQGDLLVKCSVDGGGRHVAMVDGVIGGATKSSVLVRTSESRGGLGLCSKTSRLARLLPSHSTDPKVRHWRHSGTEFNFVLQPN